MASKNDERIKVSCDCGAKLMAPRKAVGKKVRCPTCSRILLVPDPGSSVDRMLHALGNEEINTQALEEQPPPPEPEQTNKGKLCPRCNIEMGRQAVLCIRCGFHIERGVAVTADTTEDDGGIMHALKFWKWFSRS
jgi:hypothetical protein